MFWWLTGASKPKEVVMDIIIIDYTSICALNKQNATEIKSHIT